MFDQFRLIIKYTVGLSILLMGVTVGFADSVKTGAQMELTKSGIKSPYYWYLWNTKTKKSSVKFYGKLGPIKAAPGNYQIWVRFKSNQQELPYKDIVISDGKISKVALDSGLSISETTAKRAKSYYWQLRRKDLKKPLNIRIDQGYLPLAPGHYSLWLKAGYSGKFIEYSKFVIPEGKPLPLEFKTGIDFKPVANRTNHPYRWSVINVKTNKPVLNARGEFKFVPVMPGRYRISYKFSYYQSKLQTDEFDIAAGATKIVSIETGINLPKPAGMKDPLYEWRAVNLGDKKKSSQGKKFSGFAPLYAGKYRIEIRNNYYHRWISLGEHEIKQGETKSLKVDTGVSLVAGAHKNPAPYYWQVYQVGAKKYFSQSYNAWGYMALPPGKYELRVRYHRNDNYQNVTAFEVVAGKVKSISLDSGIHFESGFKEQLKPLGKWKIFRGDADDKPLVETSMRWGALPLAPGQYVFRFYPQSKKAFSKKITVEAGKFLSVKLSELGVGLLNVELPIAKNVLLASGSDRVDVTLVQGELKQTHAYYNYKRKGNPAQFRYFAVPGDASLEFKSGIMQFAVPVNMPDKSQHVVNFDATKVATQAKLGLFQVKKVSAGSSKARLIVSDKENKVLLATRENPKSDVLWLAPADANVVMRNTFESITKPLQAGSLSALEFTLRDKKPDINQKSGTKKIKVQIQIEAPKEGEVVRTQAIKLIGRASATGPIGATRIAVVFDASGSTSSSSGADIDGDGKKDNILKAEIAAVEMLIKELQRVEDKSPGTAFELAVLCFNSDPKVVSPLVKMSNKEKVAGIYQALKNHRKICGSGGTNYEKAFDKSVEVLDAKTHNGKSIILFLSDGAPGSIPGSLNSAMRAGSANVTVHAFGLGRSFQGKIDPKFSYPPVTRSAVNTLAAVSGVAYSGGSVTAVPKPADILSIIPKLPVLELPEAEIKQVIIKNKTTGKDATNIKLTQDGAFSSDVALSLKPSGAHDSNTLTATAIAKDNVSKATAEVTVVPFIPGPGKLRIIARDKKIPGMGGPKVELIIDASGSMRDRRRRIRGRLKIDVAKRVMANVIRELPADTQVALRVYGRKIREGRKGACQDTELLYPFAKINKPRLLAKVRSIRALGTTPIAYTLQQVEKDFANASGEKIVILVTDGKEECKGDVVKVVEELRKKGLKLRLNVVGFALAEKKVKEQMKQIATMTGGKFYDAQNAKTLQNSIKDSLKVPYDVYAANKDKSTLSGIVNGETQTILEGEYKVKIQFPDQVLELDKVKVNKDKMTTIELVNDKGKTKANIKYE